MTSMRFSYYFTHSHWLSILFFPILVNFFTTNPQSWQFQPFTEERKAKKVQIFLLPFRTYRKTSLTEFTTRKIGICEPPFGVKHFGIKAIHQTNSILFKQKYHEMKLPYKTEFHRFPKCFNVMNRLRLTYF